MNDERIISGITKALYEQDGMLMNFEGKVISCEKYEYTDKSGNTSEKFAIVLDRTAFFPEGGGQSGDEGTINDIRIIDVKTDEDGRILHFADEAIPEGTNICGEIDYKLRLGRMQNHGAEHLLCGLIHKQYGYENVGFHMGADGVVFDVSGLLPYEQLQQIEKRANEIVYENVPITISFPGEDELKALDYRSKLDVSSNLRIVSIGSYDTCACCAPHLESTGQIGVIKIIDAMPHRQGTRITMIAGLDAYKDYVRLHETNGEIMELLSSKRETTASFTADLLNRNNKLKEENGYLKRELSGLVSEKVLERIKNRQPGDRGIEVIFTDILDNVGLRNLINSCTETFDGIVVGLLGNDEKGYRYICSTGGDHKLTEFARDFNARFNGKGGGSPQMIQGSISGKESDIREFLNNYTC